MTESLPGSSQYLVISDGLCAGHHPAWLGPWPPPEEICAVEGRMTPATVVEKEKVEGNYDELVRLGFRIEVLRRVRYSETSDEAAKEMTHVARGAEYVRDRGWP